MNVPRDALKPYSPLLKQKVAGPQSEYPVVASANVSVHRIGTLWRQGHTPEAIASEHFPGLVSLAEVFAALSCFCANEEVFEAAFEDDQRLAATYLRATLARAE